MSKTSNRDKILTEGLRVVHQRGFAGASVRDIVQAAGVPQGSFTNHFTSKEAFGQEILDLYYANTRRLMAETLRDNSKPPLERLRAYIERYKDRLSQNNAQNGCLIGNMAAEACEHSEPMRQQLADMFAEGQASFTYCLNAAVAAGELPADFAVSDIAGMIVSSLQGAILLSKANRNLEPFERFQRVLFAKILR